MISQVFTQDTFKIMSLFALSPGSRLNRKDIKEKTRLNNIPLDKALMRLRSARLLKKEGNYYAISFENEYVNNFLAICSKQHKQTKKLPLSVYLLLSDFVFQASVLKGVEVYLFGSYSKLVFRKESDIDIAVLIAKDVDRKDLVKLTKKLEKVYSKNIELHFFYRKKFYANKKDPLIKEILKNGTALV